MIPRQHDPHELTDDGTGHPLEEAGTGPAGPDAWIARGCRARVSIPGASAREERGDCPSRLRPSVSHWYYCTRDAGHPGRHLAMTMTRDEFSAAWPGSHEPTEADLTDPAPALSTPAGDYVGTLIPATWWIATDLDDDPAVFAPCVAKGCLPEAQLRRADVTAELWAVFARALPDRGTCTACTATACLEHGGDAA